MLSCSLYYFQVLKFLLESGYWRYRTTTEQRNFRYAIKPHLKPMVLNSQVLALHNRNYNAKSRLSWQLTVPTSHAYYATLFSYVIRSHLCFPQDFSLRWCTESMKMKLSSSIVNIYTRIMKALTLSPNSLHKCITKMEEILYSKRLVWLLRLSHSSVYLYHIRTESSWVQQEVTHKVQLIKYLQFGTAN